MAQLTKEMVYRALQADTALLLKVCTRENVPHFYLAVGVVLADGRHTIVHHGVFGDIPPVAWKTTHAEMTQRLVGISCTERCECYPDGRLHPADVRVDRKTPSGLTFLHPEEPIIAVSVAGGTAEFNQYIAAIIGTTCVQLMHEVKSAA